MEQAVMIPVICGISQVIKQLNIDVKYIPLINLIIGVFVCSAASAYSADGFQWMIFDGLIAGLAASGLYSSAKNVVQGAKGR